LAIHFENEIGFINDLAIPPDLAGDKDTLRVKPARNDGDVEPFLRGQLEATNWAFGHSAG
jgi:hypothetical protein